MDLVYKFRLQILLVLVGLLLIGVGLYFAKVFDFESHEVEVLGETASESGLIVVEISGAVNKPGVYEFSEGGRVNDLLNKAEGVQDDADLLWVEKVINKAAVLKDGQKIYIPFLNEQSEVMTDNTESVYQSGSQQGDDQTYQSVNINTATQSDLEVLWGIGPKTAQNIIDQRPYSSVDELLEKNILKSNVFERNKDLLTVY